MDGGAAPAVQAEIGPAVGATPLPELGEATYQGLEGGLYGAGRNEPPEAHAEALRAAVAAIRPLDPDGQPSPQGRIGLLALGQSTTEMGFSTFQRLERAGTPRSPRVTPVNGAQHGVVLQNWSRSPQPWGYALAQVRRAGLTPRQVQVLHIDMAMIRAWTLGDLPQRVEEYARMMTQVLQRAERLFPNVRVAFLTSRIYGGYGPKGVDPEPYAYESGFGVRRTILAQIQGDPALNPDPAAGPVQAPLLAWGAYQWADTPDAQNPTGLVWDRADFARDGVHPSPSGRVKAAQNLRRFLETSELTTSWYLGQPGDPEPGTPPEGEPLVVGIGRNRPRRPARLRP